MIIEGTINLIKFVARDRAVLADDFLLCSLDLFFGSWKSPSSISLKNY
jgi:hypothetical protein